MDLGGLRWVIEWRASVRSRLEGVRPVVLVQFARSAEGACSAAQQVVDEAIDGEIRISIESQDRAQRRHAVIADKSSVMRWDWGQSTLPARYWKSKWAEAERAANIRTIVGMDFDEAVRRCVHARLLDDTAGAALLATIDAALDAYAGGI
jgi:hypothetical protein